jgi:hypothetical protein
MKCLATEGRRNPYRTEVADWKKTVSDTLQTLNIIPDRFNGRITVTFKDGGVSYLEKTETMK